MIVYVTSESELHVNGTTRESGRREATGPNGGFRRWQPVARRALSRIFHARGTQVFWQPDESFSDCFCFWQTVEPGRIQGSIIIRILCIKFGLTSCGKRKTGSVEEKLTKLHNILCTLPMKYGCGSSHVNSTTCESGRRKATGPTGGQPPPRAASCRMKNALLQERNPIWALFGTHQRLKCRAVRVL